MKEKANCKKSVLQVLDMGNAEKVGWGMPNRGMLSDAHILHVVERLRSLL